MKRKAKKCPTNCPICSSFQPVLLSLTPKPRKVRCTMHARLTVQGTATWAHDFQMAPGSGYPTRLGAQRLPPHLEATAPPETTTSWENQRQNRRRNQRRAVRRDISVYRSSRGGWTLTQPALPHAGHELFPQQRIRHGYFQGEAPRPGTSGRCTSILAAGTLPPPPRCPPRPPRRPPPPRASAPASPGAAQASARLPRPGRRRGPGAERPPQPYLRVCG